MPTNDGYWYLGALSYLPLTATPSLFSLSSLLGIEPCAHYTSALSPSSIPVPSHSLMTDKLILTTNTFVLCGMKGIFLSVPKKLSYERANPQEDATFI